MIYEAMSPRRPPDKQRDAEHQIRLYEMGWTVLVIWECEMKELGAVRARIRVFLEGATRPLAVTK